MSDSKDDENLIKLFENIKAAFKEVKPTNVPEFVVQFMFSHYPSHLVKAPELLNCDVNLAKDREIIRSFFVFYKLGSAVVNPILNAGYDTLDSLATLRPDKISEIERLNSLTFLPGHKVRLEAILSDISLRIKVFLNSINPESVGTDQYNQQMQPLVAPPVNMIPIQPQWQQYRPPQPYYTQPNFSGLPMWKDIPDQHSGHNH